MPTAIAALTIQSPAQGAFSIPMDNGSSSRRVLVSDLRGGVLGADGTGLSEHFTHGLRNCASAVSGASAGVTQRPSEAGRPGIVRCGTGTTATGRAWVGFGFAGTGSHILTDGSTYFGALRRHRALSTGTEEFTEVVGLFDILTAEPTNGVYFKYDRAITGVNWQAVAANAGVYTTTDTGIVAAASTTTMDALEIRVNATGTSVGYYINGTLVATIATANIPASISGTGPGVLVRKTVSAGVESLSEVDQIVLYKGVGV